MSKQKLSPKQTVASLNALLSKVRRYSFLAFVLFVTGIYGFVLLRINTLSTMPPSSEAIASNETASTRVPRIDPTVLKQLKSLQDNSVSVNTLFQEARNNPFQE